MACSLSLAPLAQLRLLAGQEHGRTIPLTDIGFTITNLHAGMEADDDREPLGNRSAISNDGRPIIRVETSLVIGSLMLWINWVAADH
jgi:hypothetical protein